MTKDMSVRQAMDLAESDRIHEGAELHDLPMCRAMIVMHDEIERLTAIEHDWNEPRVSELIAENTRFTYEIVRLREAMLNAMEAEGCRLVNCSAHQRLKKALGLPEGHSQVEPGSHDARKV